MVVNTIFHEKSVVHSYFIINTLIMPKKLTEEEKKKKKEAKKRYDNYIRSHEWKKIKEKVLERDGYRCQACDYCPDEDLSDKKRILSVHHKTYRHLFHETNHLEDLITLCSCCHRAIHSSPSNWQRFKMSE